MKTDFKKALERFKYDNKHDWEKPYKYDWEIPYKDYVNNNSDDIKRKVDELIKKMNELNSPPNITIGEVHRVFTSKELLDSIDIDVIDLYVRNKKLEKIQKKIKK